VSAYCCASKVHSTAILGLVLPIAHPDPPVAATHWLLKQYPLAYAVVSAGIVGWDPNTCSSASNQECKEIYAQSQLGCLPCSPLL
jgi:hypothetical protein